MWRKPTATAVAGVSWGLAAADIFAPGVVLLPADGERLLLAVAVCSTLCLMIRCYQRPLGAAYDMGYEAGRRDVILEANRRELSPIKKVPLGLREFNRANLHKTHSQRERQNS